jgi:hypothetical protein
MIPHWPVDDTFLAAALATLGVELDSNAPYTRIVDTGNNQPPRTQFLFRDCSITDTSRKTDAIIFAWRNPREFIPVLPAEVALKAALAPMLKAKAARAWLLKIIHGEPVPATQDTSETLVTPLLREAILYAATGIPMKAFNDPNFTFCQAARCRETLDTSLKPHGKTDAQWIDRYLTNLDQLIAFTKKAPTTLKTVEDGKVLWLDADATNKTRDLFFAQM